MANYLQAQVIKGTVKDRADNKPIPYVNIVIKGGLLGTVSKYDGSFSIDISSRTQGRDSLIFSVIGYKTVSLHMNQIKDSAEVKMVKTSVSLKSVIVSPRTPEEYIQMAIDNIPENYIDKPFNGTIHFKTEIKLNGKFIESSEAIIKGYIMPVMGEMKDSTRLKMLAFKYFDEEEEAINSIISKKRKKKGNKMAIEGLDSAMLDLTAEMSKSFGIYTQLDSNMIKQLYLKGKPDLKTKYWFEHMVMNKDRNLMKIGFKSNIENIAKQRGDLFLDEESLAFEAFNTQIYSSKLKIKLLLMVFGIGFKGFEAVIRFNSIPSDLGWIPDLTNVNIFVDMEKNKWFAKDIPIQIEVSSYVRFLKVEVPATDECLKGELIKKKIPLRDQFESDPNNPLWKEFEQELKRH